MIVQLFKLLTPPYYHGGDAKLSPQSEIDVLSSHDHDEVVQEAKPADTLAPSLPLPSPHERQGVVVGQLPQLCPCRPGHCSRPHRVNLDRTTFLIRSKYQRA